MWTKRDDFGLSRATRNREVTYICTAPTSIIKELKLVESIGGMFFLNAIASTNNAYDQIKLVFVQAGFTMPTTIQIARKMVSVLFVSASDPRIQVFINMLRTVCNLDTIVDEINRYIASVSPELPGAQIFPGGFRIGPNRSNLFRRPPSPISTSNLTPIFPITPDGTQFFMSGGFIYAAGSNPTSELGLRPLQRNEEDDIYARDERNSELYLDIDANARRLDELGWQGGWPKEYECAITHLLMTDPVFAKGNSNVKFERSAIEFALDSDPRHPTTRAPLCKEGLVDDKELRKEIRYFMQNIERAARIAYHQS